MSFAPKITHRRARHPSKADEKTGSSKLRAASRPTGQNDEVESTVSSTPNNNTRDSDPSPLQNSNRTRESEVSSTMTALLGIPPLPAAALPQPSTPLPDQVPFGASAAGVPFLDASKPGDQGFGVACLESAGMKGLVDELAAALHACSTDSVLDAVQPFVSQCQTNLEASCLLFCALHQSQHSRSAQLAGHLRMAAMAVGACALLCFTASCLWLLLATHHLPPV